MDGKAYIAIIQNVYRTTPRVFYRKFFVPEDAYPKAMLEEGNPNYERLRIRVAEHYYLNKIDATALMIHCLPAEEWGGEYKEKELKHGRI